MLFLVPLLFTAAPAIPGEVSDKTGPGEFTLRHPGQMELSTLTRSLGHGMVFCENPLFSDRVARGELPPVKTRLPEEPLVVIPETEQATYGGSLTGMSLSYESGTSEILSWRQANLVRFSQDNHTIVPNVAKSWEWNRDYSRITFFLRHGHRWSDGAPFTADDILFYINDIILNQELHPEIPSPWREFGVKAQKSNDTEITLIFEKPFPSLLFYLGGNGSYYDPFAPKHFLKKYHIRYNKNAGNEALALGFKSWTDRFGIYWNRWKDAVAKRADGLSVPTLESHILKKAPAPEGRLFEANPYYFKIDTLGRQLPYISYHRERFISKKDWINEILAGRVDQKSQNMPLDSYLKLMAGQDKGNYTVQLPITGLGPVIFFNKTHKDPVKWAIYASPEFNCAMSLAIDRDHLNRTFFLGLGTPGQAIPQNLPFITEKEQTFMVRYDPEEAGSLLDSLGLKRGNDGSRRLSDGRVLTIDWEFSLQYLGSEALARAIADNWRALGIHVNLKEVPTKKARESQLANDNDISNEWVAPFEPTLFASPATFMPPYGTAYPVTGIPWLQWKQSNGKSGDEPPQWVKDLWELGDEFTTQVPGSDWYNSLGQEIIRLNLANLSAIGTVSKVPLVTVVSNRLGNVPRWQINSFYYGYAYPYRPDQWYFK